MSKKTLFSTPLLSVFLLLSLSLYGENPVSTPLSVYLTWQQDPTTTMTIQWITDHEDEGNRIDFQK